MKPPTKAVSRISRSGLSFQNVNDVRWIIKALSFALNKQYLRSKWHSAKLLHQRLLLKIRMHSRNSVAACM